MSSPPDSAVTVNGDGSEPDITHRQLGFDTRSLHAGHSPKATAGTRAVPIYQTTSYVFDDADHAAQLFELKEHGNIYTRINNPTTAVFEARMASLENGSGALGTSSGMAAQFTALMTLLRPGDDIVASRHLYGGTVTQFTHTLNRLGVSVTFVEPDDFDAWEEAIGPNTKALYGETIGNPRGSILDIETVSGLARSKGIPFVIDNTFATPYLCRPIDWGADVVVHSATKFIGGHGSSIGGVIVDSGRFDYGNYPSIASPSPSYHGLRFFETFGELGFIVKARAETLRDVGACLSPFNAFLLLQGLETLSLRMERHVSNAHALAEFLNEHDGVEWVAFAGLNDSPYRELARKYVPLGPGAVFTFGLKSGADGPRAAGKQFIDALQLFSHLANVGDARSLVIHPATTTHQQLSDAELTDAGIRPEMIRLSVGLEDVEDLKWDLDQALGKVNK
jgi:O-acetylhomoserine (thiol)-lyase